MRLSRPLCRAVVAIALAACGGGGAGTSTPTSPSTPSPAPSPTPSGAPASIAVSPSTLAFAALGATDSLRVDLRDEAGRTVSGTVAWSTSNAAVASVAPNGVVTSEGNGSADLVATLGALRAVVRVTIAQQAAAVALGTTDLTLPGAGATHQMTAAVRDARGRDVVGAVVGWTSSDTTVARISSSGLVTALRAGTTTIGARAQTISASSRVTVAGTSTTPSPSACTPFEGNLIDPALLKVVTQIGVIGGANTEIVGRVYLFAKDGTEGQRLALTAPGPLELVGARHYIPPGAPAGYLADWSLMLDAGCGNAIELYHVKDLSPSIKAAIDTTIYPSSGWQPLPSRLRIASGETFGWYVRGLNSVAFDLIAHSATVSNRFTNQARYDAMNSFLRDVVCPWSLFAPARRDAYLSLIGAPTGERVPGAGCGSVDRDVAGTPAGQWFLTPTAPAAWQISKTGFYGDPMPIILGVDGTVYVGHTGPNDDLRIDRTNPTWKDPATITTSWCYQAGASGWLWLRMVSATQMQAAYGTEAACPASFPSTGFATYYR